MAWAESQAGSQIACTDALLLLLDAGLFPNRFPPHDLALDVSLELLGGGAADARPQPRDPLAHGLAREQLMHRLIGLLQDRGRGPGWKGDAVPAGDVVVR